MENELIVPGTALDDGGNVAEAGWARSWVRSFNRETIRFDADRLKEWNYFFVGDENYGIGVSLANVGSFHRMSCSFMDYKNNRQINRMSISPARSGAIAMGLSPFDDVHFRNEEAEGLNAYRGESAALAFTYANFDGPDRLNAAVFLDAYESDTLQHVFPFDGEPGLFFLCHKAVNYNVSGVISIGDFSYELKPETAFAAKDWGRGVWPRRSTPFWSCTHGRVEGRAFGWNLGYRYSEYTGATENALFVDGVAHKLGVVTFEIQDDETSFTKPWFLRDADGRMDVVFHPVLDRTSSAPEGIGYSADQHQVFGYFSGRVVLDDGQALRFDRLFGFAEKLVNDW